MSDFIKDTQDKCRDEIKNYDGARKYTLDACSTDITSVLIWINRLKIEIEDMCQFINSIENTLKTTKVFISGICNDDDIKLDGVNFNVNDKKD